MNLSPRSISESSIKNRQLAAQASPCPHEPTITSADVVANQIKTTLPKAGVFTLTLFNDNAPEPNYQILQVNRQAGSYTDSFGFPNMPTGLYTSIEASLEVDGEICHTYFAYKFQNLGIYRHSQYNTPDESNPTCAGTAVNVCFTDASCNFTPGTLSSVFKAKVDLNGSGKSASHGNIQPEAFCIKPPRVVPAQCQNKGVYRANVVIKPSCAGGTLSNTTVAVGDNGPLVCNDKICIVGAGQGGANIVKTVTDRCPACIGKMQIDNYTTDGRCSGIPDLGNFVTIKLF